MAPGTAMASEGQQGDHPLGVPEGLIASFHMFSFGNTKGVVPLLSLKNEAYTAARMWAFLRPTSAMPSFTE